MVDFNIGDKVRNIYTDQRGTVTHVPTLPGEDLGWTMDIRPNAEPTYGDVNAFELIDDETADALAAEPAANLPVELMSVANELRHIARYADRLVVRSEHVLSYDELLDLLATTVASTREQTAALESLIVPRNFA